MYDFLVQLQWHTLSARCFHHLFLRNDQSMVHKDLVIIGISVGVAAGVLITSIIVLGICWYKKHAHLPRSTNEGSLATLPIRENGLGASIEMSASLSNSVIIKGSDYLAKKPRNSWWSNHSKEQFTSASGLPRYSYKYVRPSSILVFVFFNS